MYIDPSYIGATLYHKNRPAVVVAIYTTSPHESDTNYYSLLDTKYYYPRLRVTALLEDGSFIDETMISFRSGPDKQTLIEDEDEL